MEAITNTINEQKCNQNTVDAMPALYAFALQQHIPEILEFKTWAYE